MQDICVLARDYTVTTVLACVASVSVRCRSKERGTSVKDRAKNGASKRAGRGWIFLCSETRPNGNACHAGYYSPCVPKILETSVLFPFPLQYGDVDCKVTRPQQHSKREKRNERERNFPSVSRFMSEVVG